MEPPQKQTLEQPEGLTDEQAREYAIAMKGSAVRVAAEKLTGRYTIERRLEEMEFYREEMEQAGWLPTVLQQYQEDNARVMRLRELREQYRSWENQGPFHLDNKQTAKSESISSDDIDRSTLNSIHRAAAEYFNRVNRNSNFDIAQTGIIFEDLVYELETMIAVA